MRNPARTLLIALLLAPWGGVQADAAGDVCAALRTARIHLIALMGATDGLTLNNHRDRLHAASDRLDGHLAAMRQGADAGDATRAAEFEPVWRAFRHTRETEIIPAVQAGRAEIARGIALGVQAERMQAMNAIMGCPR